MSVIHSGDGSRTCVFGLQRQSWCGIKSKNTYMREGCINTDHSIGKFPKKKTKKQDLEQKIVGLLPRLEVNCSNLSLMNLDPSCCSIQSPLKLQTSFLHAGFQHGLMF